MYFLILFISWGFRYVKGRPIELTYILPHPNESVKRFAEGTVYYYMFFFHYVLTLKTNIWNQINN